MSKFTWPEAPNQTAFPIAKSGYPFIFASAFTTGIFALLNFSVLALLSLVATFFICYFFRDPDRVIPVDEKVLVSPADGKVIKVKKINGNRFFKGECIKISIFMSVFNVHVNRIPHDGKVIKIQYFPGKFFSANLDKASKENEHNAIFLETKNGGTLCVVQIAGLIARRILCKISEGDHVLCGKRFGMICFGSRVDVYLDPETRIEIKEGDKVRAGSSVLGYVK